MCFHSELNRGAPPGEGRARPGGRAINHMLVLVCSVIGAGQRAQHDSTCRACTSQGPNQLSKAGGMRKQQGRCTQVCKQARRRAKRVGLRHHAHCSTKRSSNAAVQRICSSGASDTVLGSFHARINVLARPFSNHFCHITGSKQLKCNMCSRAAGQSEQAMPQIPS